MGVLHVRQRCPKCGGNLFLYNDHNGWYEECLQCSYTLYLDVVYEDRSEVDSSKTPEISKNTTSGH